MAHQAAGLRYAVRFRVLARYFGQLCIILGVLTAVPLGVSLIHGEYGLALRYLVAAGGAALCGLLARTRAPTGLQVNEGMVIVASAFLFASLIMTIPIMGTGLGFFDALFETVSGSTTTGLTTLRSVEDASPVILFSRAWMQWYGGLGIVVLSVALVLRPGRTAKDLAVAEADPEDLPGSTQAHARRVLLVYCLISFGGILALLLLGVGPFQALLYSMAAVSTGGFAPHDDSLAGLGGWVAPAVVTLLGLLCAMPLTVFRRHSNRNGGATLAGLQVWGLLAVGAAASVLLCGSLRFGGMSWEDTLRNGPLLALSAQTTAGFSTTSVSELGASSKLLLIASMVTGGGVGSTAGGFKILRLLIVGRVLHSLIVRTSLPQHAVLEPRLGRRRLSQNDVVHALLLVLLYPLLSTLFWVPFLCWGYDPLDSLFEVVSATGTVGLSTGIASASLPVFLKLVLCAAMLLGRLECIAWFVFVYPGTWIGRRR